MIRIVGFRKFILTMFFFGGSGMANFGCYYRYGDSGDWSISGPSTSRLGNSMRKKKGGVASGRLGGLRDWEEVFRMDPGRNKKNCCG